MVPSAAGKPVANKTRPTGSGSQIGHDLVLRKCIPDPVLMVRFRLAYCQYISDSEIEREKFADKMLGSMRHGLELGIGALLIKNEIYPLSKYFRTIRKAPAGCSFGSVQPAAIVYEIMMTE